MTLIGTNSSDNINATEGNDDIYALQGDDYIFAFGGNDIINYFTGSGVNASGQAVVGGTDGHDIVDGGTGTDVFRVFTSDHFSFTGSSSNVYALSFNVGAGVNGSVIFSTRQNWDNWSPPINTAQSDVTLTNVESLHYFGRYAEPEESSYPVLFTSIDNIVVGDLSGTQMTGELFFDLGVILTPGNQTFYRVPIDDDILNASGATNRIVALGGMGDDRLTGGLAADELLGQDGNDTLSGGLGNNTLIGGLGDDIYVSANRYDSIIEMAGAGFDTIRTETLYFVSRENIEMLEYANPNGLPGAGNFIGIGSAGNETITGGSGHDYLIGLAGDDTLSGGTGDNSLQGGVGDDTYITTSSGDTIIEFANEGVDTIVTDRIFYRLADNLENLRGYTGERFEGIGNAVDNIITGGTGAISLSGLGGNDTLQEFELTPATPSYTNSLVGGAGDDHYVVFSNSASLVELAGEGTDRVTFYGTSFGLAAQVENLSVAGASDTSIKGNELANSLSGHIGRDNLAGGSGDDVIAGEGGNDFLSGGVGNDVLIGGMGGDELSGGAGADRFVFRLGAEQKDLIHDFSSTEGDKIDVSALLASVGYAGGDPFADGYITFAAIQAFGSVGAQATRIIFDPDGLAGGAASFDLAIALGGTSVVGASDFIVV